VAKKPVSMTATRGLYHSSILSDKGRCACCLVSTLLQCLFPTYACAYRQVSLQLYEFDTVQVSACKTGHQNWNASSLP